MLVLVAVFLPVAFLGGVTGTLYQQFAVTIAISVVISGIMALTLSPALAAIIIKAHHGEKKGFFRWFENGFAAPHATATSASSRALIQGWPIALARVRRRDRRHPADVPHRCRGSFVPDEDQGYFFVVVEAPDTASQDVRRRSSREQRARRSSPADPAVQDVASVNGYSLVDGQYPQQRGGHLRVAEAVRRAHGPVAAHRSACCRG